MVSEFGMPYIYINIYIYIYVYVCEPDMFAAGKKLHRLIMTLPPQTPPPPPSLHSAPFRSISLHSAPFRSIPLHSTPTRRQRSARSNAKDKPLTVQGRYVNSTAVTKTFESLKNEGRTSVKARCPRKHVKLNFCCWLGMA